MHARNTFLAIVRRIMFAAVFTIGMGSTLTGQTPAPKSTVSTKQVHWHKYENRTYGFSLWYPDTYVPVPHPYPERWCRDTDDYKCLLWLVRRDHLGGAIWVNIDPQRFHLFPGAGDVTPTRQLTGRHIFYGGMRGSMGVGFSDFYDMNLKGKTLSIEFGPDDSVNPSEETKQLEHKMLKTLRTFQPDDDGRQQQPIANRIPSLS